MSKITRTIALLTFAAISVLSVSGADLKHFILRSAIYETGYQPLDSVEVNLMKNDTTAVDFKLLTGDNESRILTDNNLRMMVNSGIGDYCLTLYKEGYEILVKRFTIASVSEDVKYLPALVLEKERHPQLEEVTVQATRIKMVMKGDTIVYDAAAFKLSEGSMLDVLVRQLPGATLSPDGVIEVNGRKINELLLNGKDFFKGDPKVALQNLPAYTVKNLKVYDKAGKDDYLTHTTARLDRREEEENLVMDVVLKKEYDTGYMANAEGGYGTSDRYMGRAFGLGYTDRFRLAAFVNANNTGDRTQGGTSGQWRGATAQENGKQDLLMTGVDYSYSNPEKILATGNVTYTGLTDHNNDLTATTRFFQTGDIYGRSSSKRRDRTRTLNTTHSFELMTPNIYYSINPEFGWSRIDRKGDNRSATFTEAPSESFRGEALDSIFSSRSSAAFTRHMLTRLREMSASDEVRTNGSLKGYMTIRPRTWKGMLIVNASGRFTHTGADSRKYYEQAYGPASSSTDAPVNEDRFNTLQSNTRSAAANVTYSQSFRKFSDTRSKNLTVQAQTGYSHNHEDKDNRLFSADQLPDPLTPPSASMGAGLMPDPANSPYTYQNTNSLTGYASLNFINEPTAPKDSAMNPTVYMMASLRYGHDHQNYRYTKMGYVDQFMTRNTDFLSPAIRIGFNSSNKVRNIYTTLYWSQSRSAPDFAMLVNTSDSSDPLNIYTGNPDGLKNSTSNNFILSWTRTSRSASNSRTGADVSWNVRTNSAAYAQRYNPATGVTTYTPENISGNWQTTGNIWSSRSFGRQRNLTVNVSMMATIKNSADYVAADGKPVRSSVLTQSYWPNVSVDYTTRSGSTLTVGMRTTIASQHAAREGFNNMTWYEYWPYLRAFIKLPESFDLNTQLNPYFRRGYTDQSMNTSEVVWNATLTKTFTRPAITLKLTAYDILGSSKHVYGAVNAQGRTETWRYTLPRYVMLSAVYRLDMKPRSKRN